MYIRLPQRIQLVNLTPRAMDFTGSTGITLIIILYRKRSKDDKKDIPYQV